MCLYDDIFHAVTLQVIPPNLASYILLLPTLAVLSYTLTQDIVVIKNSGLVHNW